MAPLKERLAAEFPSFNFFQAVGLIEESLAATGDSRPLESGRLRFTADSRLSFPASDIAGATEHNGTYALALSFMGLIGASSPLPVYFSELPMRNPEAAQGLSTFLAIFNHRCYALFYRAWKKYHFLRTLSPSGNDPFSSAISALAGMADGCPDSRLRAFAGLLAGRSRGARGLESLLSTWFGNIPVRVTQWVARRTALPDLAPLGNRCCLGSNAVAGTTVIDRAGSFRVTIGPLPLRQYESFLGGSANIAELKSLVRRYLIDMLEFDIEVCLQSADLIPVVLGKNDAQLGATSSLGQSPFQSGVQSVVFEG